MSPNSSEAVSNSVTHTQLEHTISHPWISYDEEKWILNLDESAIEAITLAIEEMKAQLLSMPEKVQTSEIVWISSSLVDAWITSEKIKLDKKGRVDWLLGGILKHVRKNRPVPKDQLEKVVKKVWDSRPWAYIWVKIGERMLPVPLIIWENSTFDSVRKWFEVRVRNAGILDRPIKVSSH